MGAKKNPQITISQATFNELQEIAEKWGLPSPGLAVGLMVKQFGSLMREGMLQPSTAVYRDAVETTTNNNSAVVSTADNSKPVETTGNGTPTAAFLDMNF